MGLALSACGGTTSPGGVPDAGHDYTLETCVQDGIEFCGPDLCDGDCGGPPCEPITNIHNQLVTGICRDYDNWWPGGGIPDCVACRTQDACTSMGYMDSRGFGLWCVSHEVCDVLRAHGVEMFCTFSDKSEYSTAPVPYVADCPSVREVAVCGGSCGECMEGSYCSGRSPSHPVGLCFEGQGPNLPERPGASICRPGRVACHAEGDGCFVYAVSGQPFTDYASEYGVCLPQATCIDAATVLPGGGACFDHDSNLIAGSLAATFNPLVCPEQGNPLFGSCLDPFLYGCFAPDGKGTCENDGATITWADGYRIESSGDASALFAPGASSPCIEMQATADVATWTRGDLTITIETGSGDTLVVTCPDASQVTTTFTQMESYVRCRGVGCP